VCFSCHFDRFLKVACFVPLSRPSPLLFNKQPISVGDIMRRKQLHIFADKVAELLMDNPKGLSSYEIFNRLADDRSNMRWLPSRHTIGSRLSGIVGVDAVSVATGYSTTTSRQVVLWALDIDRFNEWRNKDAR